SSLFPSASRCRTPAPSDHHEPSGLPMISLTSSSRRSGSMGRRNGRISSKLIAFLGSDGRPGSPAFRERKGRALSGPFLGGGVLRDIPDLVVFLSGLGGPIQLENRVHPNL